MKDSTKRTAIVSMRIKSSKHPQRQRGFSTLQVVAALAIAGTLTAAAARVLFPMYNRAQINNAYEELYMVAHAVREVREYAGNYQQVADFKYLVDNGYLPTDRYTTGANENSFGETITAVQESSGADVKLTYQANTGATCENLLDRMITVSSVKKKADGTVDGSCAAQGKLEVKID